MKSKLLGFIVLNLQLLLIACSSQQPAEVVSSSVNYPITPIERTRSYFPISGQRTVSDVLQIFGKSAEDKLKYYFTRAKVIYPPREVAFIALKHEKKLELWAKDSGDFRFIRDYYILAASGEAGPKLRQGDRQVPEGIYRITELNPNSQFHLSMKLNYPNSFDLTHAEMDGRDNPGSDIFIHGKAASVGCLAMGDTAIRELFVLTAQVGVGNVRVVIAPHDPRYHPLVAYSEEMPPWTSELYMMIAREIEAVTHSTKSVKARL